MSAFQAEEGGSIPLTRSRYFIIKPFGLFFYLISCRIYLYFYIMKKIILVSLLSVLGIVLIGFLVIKFQLIGFKQTTESINNANSEEDISWSEYVSDDNVFKISHPSDWEVLNDENFIFSIKAKQSDAVIRVKKILATDKKELQKALDQENKNCVAQKEA